MTAITALNDLGVNYNYSTQLYADGLPTEVDSVFNGHVYIRAGYDPLFDADDMHAFAHELKNHGITRITSPICLDLSMKDDKKWVGDGVGMMMKCLQHLYFLAIATLLLTICDAFSVLKTLNGTEQPPNRRHHQVQRCSAHVHTA